MTSLPILLHEDLGRLDEMITLKSSEDPHVHLLTVEGPHTGLGGNRQGV